MPKTSPMRAMAPRFSVSTAWDRRPRNAGAGVRTISSMGGHGRRAAQASTPRWNGKPTSDRSARGHDVHGDAVGHLEARAWLVAIGHQHRDRREPAGEQPLDQLLTFDHELTEPRVGSSL